MGLENVYAFFETYDKATYVAVACQGSEPTEGDLAAFEGDVGFRLPEEFRKFTLSPLGGLYFEVKEEIWPRAKAYDVGPFWTFL